jgi:hypothetical protein
MRGFFSKVINVFTKDVVASAELYSFNDKSYVDLLDMHLKNMRASQIMIESISTLRHYEAFDVGQSQLKLPPCLLILPVDDTVAQLKLMELIFSNLSLFSDMRFVFVIQDHFFVLFKNSIEMLGLQTRVHFFSMQILSRSEKINNFLGAVFKLPDFGTQYLHISGIPLLMHRLSGKVGCHDLFSSETYTLIPHVASRLFWNGLKLSGWADLMAKINNAKFIIGWDVTGVFTPVEKEYDKQIFLSDCDVVIKLNESISQFDEDESSRLVDLQSMIFDFDDLLAIGLRCHCVFTNNLTHYFIYKKGGCKNVVFIKSEDVVVDLIYQELGVINADDIVFCEVHQLSDVMKKFKEF